MMTRMDKKKIEDAAAADGKDQKQQEAGAGQSPS
jgi:hypothetical protein